MIVLLDKLIPVSEKKEGEEERRIEMGRGRCISNRRV